MRAHSSLLRRVALLGVSLALAVSLRAADEKEDKEAARKAAETSKPLILELPGKEPAKPAEAKPAPTTPPEAKPAEAKPAETKAAEPAPEVKLPEVKPAEAGPPEAKPAESKPAETRPAPAKPAVIGSPDGSTYVIGAEDVLAVRVWREPELSGQFPVRPDGKISLQLVNEVQASGLTPEQLGAVIAEGLSKVMTKPEVSVAVLQVNSKKYFISGEVQRPGSFPLLIPTTVLEALVNAGGFRDFANQKDIAILRAGQRFKFNYKEVSRGRRMEQNIQLLHGDHILVR